VQWSAVQDIRGGAGMRRGIADAVERDVTDSVVATPSGETFVPVITEEEEPRAALTPREVVEILDRNIVGQTDAKKAVANALRNRWRRQRIESPMKEEIVPKNILMVGPTGGRFSYMTLAHCDLCLSLCRMQLVATPPQPPGGLVLALSDLLLSMTCCNR